MLKITFHFPNAGVQTVEKIASAEITPAGACRLVRGEDTLEFLGWTKLEIEATDAPPSEPPKQ